MNDDKIPNYPTQEPTLVSFDDDVAELEAIATEVFNSESLDQASVLGLSENLASLAESLKRTRVAEEADNG